MEAFYIDGGGGDGLSVAWNLVDDEASRVLVPLANTRLRPECEAVAKMHNLYDDERVTFSKASERCEAAQGFMCDFDIVDDVHHEAFKLGYHWSTSACTIKVKINQDDSQFPGWIALVHSAGDSVMAQHVDQSTLNYFPAVWDRGYYPILDDGCAGVESDCEITPDGACVSFFHSLCVFELPRTILSHYMVLCSSVQHPYLSLLALTRSLVL